MKKLNLSLILSIAIIFSIFATSSFANITGSTLNSITTYKPGETNTLVYRCDTVSPDDEWMFTVAIQYVSNIFVTSGLPTDGDKDSMSYVGGLFY